MFLTETLKKTIKKFERKLDVLNQIEISRGAIVSNYQYLDSQIGDVWPVVKSNAYGHGAEKIVQILNKLRPTYFVADSYYDALKIIPYTQAKILISGYNPQRNIPKIDFRRVTVTIHDATTARILISLKKKINVHLMVDTGMNRDGAKKENLEDILSVLKNQDYLKLEGVFSHLADADGETNEYTKKQINKFKEIVLDIKERGFNLRYIHLANSFGIPRTKNLDWLGAARPGIGIYGFSDKNLVPALRFVSTLVQKKEIDKGDKVSYNLTFTAPKRMTIGIVPAGYYEGIDLRLSNKGYFYYQDIPLKILGRVCMNLTVVDLSRAKNIKEGERIEIISPERERLNSVENIAKVCHTIPYEIITKLAESTRRIITK